MSDACRWTFAPHMWIEPDGDDTFAIYIDLQDSYQEAQNEDAEPVEDPLEVGSKILDRWVESVAGTDTPFHKIKLAGGLKDPTMEEAQAGLMAMLRDLES